MRVENLLNKDYHFLDTNVILAMILEDESYNDAKNYLEFKSTRYINDTARSEA